MLWLAPAEFWHVFVLSQVGVLLLSNHWRSAGLIVLYLVGFYHYATGEQQALVGGIAPCGGVLSFSSSYTHEPCASSGCTCLYLLKKIETINGRVRSDFTRLKEADHRFLLDSESSKNLHSESSKESCQKNKINSSLTIRLASNSCLHRYQCACRFATPSLSDLCTQKTFTIQISTRFNTEVCSSAWHSDESIYHSCLHQYQSLHYCTRPSPSAPLQTRFYSSADLEPQVLIQAELVNVSFARRNGPIRQRADSSWCCRDWLGLLLVSLVAVWVSARRLWEQHLYKSHKGK